MTNYTSLNLDVRKARVSGADGCPEGCSIAVALDGPGLYAVLYLSAKVAREILTELEVQLSEVEK